MEEKASPRYEKYDGTDECNARSTKRDLGRTS